MPLRRPLVIVGAGRLGRALCVWLHAAGVPVAAVADRKLAAARRGARLSGAEAAWDWPRLLRHLRDLPPPLLVLAISDDALPVVARELAKARAGWRGAVVLHTSGAQPAVVLEPLRRQGAAVGAMHPMMTFSSADAPPAPAGVVFSLEGDAAAVAAARRLVRRWRGRELRLNSAQKTALHLAATLSGPGAAVLMAAAEDHLRRAGFSGARLRRARAGLAALLEATAAHLARMPTRAAFTGPWARGDARTLAAHRRRLSSSAESRLYKAVAAAAGALLAPPRTSAKSK